jgi:hypothetical protein
VPLVASIWTSAVSVPLGGFDTDSVYFAVLIAPRLAL